MIIDTLQKLKNKNDLTVNEAYEVMLTMMDGKVNNAQIAAFLTALSCKGETPEEVAGLAKAMRSKSVPFPGNADNAIDIVGTGGDHSNTINISTASAFAAAGAGVKIAKHGNRSITSKSGSADVLAELGVTISLTPEQSAKALDDIGITFLFAPDYHPAMKHVAPVRRELGFRTVFNILGPLTNPAGTKKQLIGTFNNHASNIMFKASKLLDMDKVCFVCTSDSFDEVTLNDFTIVLEYQKDHEDKNYLVSHETFGYPHVTIDDIKGGTGTENANLLRDIFKNKRKKDGYYYVIAANTTLALYVAGFDKDKKICQKAAEDSIKSGKALKKINELIEFGKDMA